MQQPTFLSSSFLQRRSFLIQSGRLGLGLGLAGGVLAQAGSLLAHSFSSGSLSSDDAIEVDEAIYETAPFPECHASTLVESEGQLVVAWFGGTEEGDDDVEIWLSRQEEGVWSAPVSVADGIEADGRRYPCWNPVLFQGGPRLYLFYKVGPNPREWWGLVKSSEDGGRTWSAATRLPDGILGPIKNKPIIVDGETLLCGSSSEHAGWHVHLEWTKDRGRTWQKTEPLMDEGGLESIQPTLLRDKDGGIRILCRARTAGYITTSRSTDGGQSWSPLEKTNLPNPNSGIDAVTLSDGRHALIYNHTPRGRSPLNLAISEDGLNWSAGAVLIDEPDAEFSYPAVIQSADGRLHVTYTWKRRTIRHLRIDPARLQLRPIVDGVWPT